MNFKLMETIKLLASHRLYVIYALAYGLSTLILPYGVQFLVNNLALSGIWLNLLTFIILIGFGLVISQIVKHSQVVIGEWLQREIFVLKINEWKNFKSTGYEHYYFEVPNLLKAFAKSYTHFIELGLIISFGFMAIILFHPAFIILALVIVLTIYNIFRSSRPAINSSIKESDEKYKMYNQLVSEQGIRDEAVDSYLFARDKHFSFIRINSAKISTLNVVSQIALLSIGSYLVKQNELSIGQLVSSEIIVSGILISLSKLPMSLEAIYDYETSEYKISKALKGSTHE